MREKVLGRGLDVLLRSVREDENSPEILMVPLEAIRPNANQPRRDFDRDALSELAASITAKGLLQPLVVRPLVDPLESYSYEIIAGERRWRASQMAGLHEVPVIMKDVSEEDSLTLALVENLQRQDLNPMEEAAGYHRLATDHGLTHDELAVAVGKSRSAVANAIRLLGLPDCAQLALRDGRISAGHARTLLAVAQELREAFLERILEANLNVREAEACAQFAKSEGVLPPVQPGATGASEQGAKRSPSRAPQVEVKEFNKYLASLTGFKIRVSGSMEQGKMSIVFDSKDRLAEIVQLLGLDMGDFS